MKENDKKKKLDYFSDNLAVPEIRVNSDRTGEDDDEQSEKGCDMIFENLAIPEIKLRNPGKNKK